MYFLTLSLLVARNRIWEELKYARSNIICIQRYTDNMRRRARAVNAFVVFCSVGGSLGGSWNKWAAVIGASLVAVASIIKSLLPNFIQSEQELSELDRLLDFYSKYMNNLERLWYEYDTNTIDEKTAMSRLFSLKEDECDKYSVLNKGVRNISEEEQKKIDQRCTDYINRTYFTKETENET